jgi:mannose-1-phosphate guanylyltransferase
MRDGTSAVRSSRGGVDQPGARPRALLLTAGLGTRLRPLTRVRAKAAVPVNGESLVRRVIRWLAGYGISDLVLNLHHRPSTIAASVGDGTDLGVRVRYSWEQPLLGSAGGPRHALPLLADHDTDAILLVNGDTLTDVDLRSLLAAHASSGAAVTMAVIPNPRPDKYGGVVVSQEGWVTGFTGPARSAGADPSRGGGAHPSGAGHGNPNASYHFVGVQAAAAHVFARLADGVPYESVTQLYPGMIAKDSKSVGVFICDARFQDIGTPGDYLATSLMLAATEGDHLHSPGASIARSAHVVRTAVWNRATIGPEARLSDCIVADGVQIPAGARYERCAIVPAGGPPVADEYVEGGLLIRAF